MSIDIRLTPDGDIYSQNEFITGIDEVVQSVIIRLKIHRTEWFLDETVGIPYIEWFGNKRNTLAGIEDILRTEILDVRGVVAVPSLSAYQQNREIYVDAHIEIEDDLRNLQDGASTNRTTVSLTVTGGAARWRII